MNEHTVYMMHFGYSDDRIVSCEIIKYCLISQFSIPVFVVQFFALFRYTVVKSSCEYLKRIKDMAASVNETNTTWHSHTRSIKH